MNPMLFSQPQTLILKRRTPIEFAGEPVRDDYGVVQYAETSVPIPAAAVWPLVSVRPSSGQLEVEDGKQDRSTETYLAAVGIDVDITYVDQVVWRGTTFRIEGETDKYHSPFTGDSIQTIRLSLVRG